MLSASSVSSGQEGSPCEYEGCQEDGMEDPEQRGDGIGTGSIKYHKKSTRTDAHGQGSGSWRTI